MRLLDFSYLEDALTGADALGILRKHRPTRHIREAILQSGYPGYDTSVGWFGYDDERVRDNARRALADGFSAFKLKVGSHDPQRDLRRARMLRELIGDEALLMLDVNQQWTLPQALEMCSLLRDVSPYWIEEPTHPDDVAAHRKLAQAIAPMRIALGEHVPNRVMFKNFLEAEPFTSSRSTPHGLRASASSSPSAFWRTNSIAPLFRTSETWDRFISIWSFLITSRWDIPRCFWNTFRTCASISERRRA